MATNTVATPASLEPIARGGFLTGLGTPAVMLLMLAMIVLPLPPIALDLLFTVSILSLIHI